VIKRGIERMARQTQAKTKLFSWRIYCNEKVVTDRHIEIGKQCRVNWVSFSSTCVSILPNSTHMFMCGCSQISFPDAYFTLGKVARITIVENANARAQPLER